MPIYGEWKRVSNSTTEDGQTVGSCYLLAYSHPVIQVTSRAECSLLHLDNSHWVQFLGHEELRTELAS
jgi:hypothetical protein